MKKTVRWLTLATISALSAVALAQTAMVDAEVRNVDAATGKLTLRHGEIKTLNMPAMTMAYPVQNRALLDKLQPGEKVRFAAEKLNGQITVTAIEPAK